MNTRYFLIYKGKIIEVDVPFNDIPMVFVYEERNPEILFSCGGNTDVAVQACKNWIDKQ